jgi:hypothetical protein
MPTLRLLGEGSHLLGLGRLSANGTLASFVVKKISSGSHTYTAQSPKDAYHDTLPFGSVTVQAESSPAN